MAQSFNQRLPDPGALFSDQTVADAGEGNGRGALVLASSSSVAAVPYRPPNPGRSLRSLARFFVLVGGSAFIGVGVAAGVFTLPAAACFAVALATGQVLAQTWRQNKLGQSVVGGIALGDLDGAQRAAERALTESPAGVMRTLAASNLASVLIQQDLVDEAARVLDQHPPGFFIMPLTTVLWLNNRAFVHLARSTNAADNDADKDADNDADNAADNDGDNDGDSDAGNDAGNEAAAAGALLHEAEKRLLKASVRDLGGPGNSRRLTAALAGTRAIERVIACDGRGALSALKRAIENDDGPGTAFRTVERELCRTEALRLLGRRDEATITLESLIGQTMTLRQQRRFRCLQKKMGLS